MQITTDNVAYIIAILSVVFSVFLFFYKPQVKSEKGEAILALKLDELSKNFTNLKDNHVHTLDVKMDTMTEAMAKMANDITRLSTIIEERIPKRRT